MLFNSFPFLLAFLPLVILLAIAARSGGGPKASQIVILLSSLVFYGWFKPSNLWYLGASILGNFLVAQSVASAEQPRRKQLLVLGLVLNIGYLFTFKYVNFLAANVPFVSQTSLHLPNLAFPLGISFFTLLQIMYLVDCYEGLVPALSLFDHATFVAFFPYVISGPIAKAKRMAHQFSNFGGEPGARSALIARGLYQFSMGLFKKVVFADAFASVANLGFGAGTRLSTLEAWSFSLAYTFQIYFDFSGYSDMAIGAGMMLGVEIPRNFDAPFRSKSIIEFWQRWHITLSNFITTYLYTPILRSFSKATLITASLATLFAMAIAGLWHGASWNFVLFGFLHGAALVINQYWRKKKMPKLPALASWLITFLFVNFAFIFFRSETIHDGTRMALSLIDLASHPIGHDIFDAARSTFTGRLGLAIVIGSVIAFLGKASDQLAREFEPTYWISVGVAAALVICCLSLVFNTTQSFVYFKF